MSELKDEDPPFWGRWRSLYTFVAVLLAVEVFLFYLLTRWAS